MHLTPTAKSHISRGERRGERRKEEGRGKIHKSTECGEKLFPLSFSSFSSPLQSLLCPLPDQVDLCVCVCEKATRGNGRRESCLKVEGKGRQEEEKEEEKGEKQEPLGGGRNGGEERKREEERKEKFKNSQFPPNVADE